MSFDSAMGDFLMNILEEKVLTHELKKATSTKTYIYPNQSS